MSHTHTYIYIYIYIKSWQVSKVDFVWRGALVWACPGLMATGGFSPKVFRRWNSPNWHPKLLNKNGALPSLPWHVPISPQKKRKAHHSMAQCVHRFFIAFQSPRFSSSFLDDWDHVSIICLCATALPKKQKQSKMVCMLHLHETWQDLQFSQELAWLLEVAVGGVLRM